MLLEPTLDRLRELRLTGMAAALEEQQGLPDIQSLSFEDRLALLVEREATVREDRRLTRLLRQARLRLPASVEELDFRSARGLDRPVVLRLAGCGWIRRHQVVLISGATGTGKTFLACALAQAACRQGLSSRYFRLSRLLEEFALARADGSYPRLMDRLQKTALLVLDDYGLAPLNQTERRDLLEVLEDRDVCSATTGTVRHGRTIMKALATIPILRILDVPKALEFYRDYLGFTVDWEHHFDPESPVYMQVSRGGLVLHLSEHYGDATPGSTVYVSVEAVRGFHEELAEKKYGDLRPGIEQTPWGSICMELTDPFGNRLRLDEKLEE